MGHFCDDHAALVVHPILVRADSAGATHGFVDSIVSANCDFSIGFPIDQGVRDALVLVQEEDGSRPERPTVRFATVPG